MKKKILIIDDEPDLVLLMEHVFLSTGLYDVVTALDGQTGQRRAVEEQPDLIFLDYIMPGLLGDAVLMFIRSVPALRSTPVVVVSGLAEPAGGHSGDAPVGRDAPGGRDGDADCFGAAADVAFPEDVLRSCAVAGVLPKPFSREDLLGMAEQVLSRFTAQEG